MSLDYNPEEENWKEFAWAALKVKTASLTSSSQCHIKEITEGNIILCWLDNQDAEHDFTNDEVHLMGILDDDLMYCYMDQKYSDATNLGHYYYIDVKIAALIDAAIAYMAGI